VDKHRLSEWILRRVCSSDRASEIMGDLLEQHSDSRVRFGLAWAQVVLALSWRSAVGVTAAFFSLFVVSATYAHFTAGKFSSGPPANDIAYVHQAWEPWAAYLCLASLCLWTIAAISISRYGIGDRLTRLSALLSVLLTFSACVAWLPHATQVIAGALLLLLGGCLSHDVYRRVLLALAATMASFAISVRVLAYVTVRIVPSRDVQVFGGYSLALLIGAWLTPIVAESLVLTHIRRCVDAGIDPSERPRSGEMIR
jgi:hypothetical protein